MDPAPPDDSEETLFTALVDDAGLFPPAELSMRDALARHRRDATESSAVLSGRFVCPSTRLGELAESLPAGERIELALIVSPFSAAAVAEAVGQLGEHDGLEVACLEGAIAADGPPARLPVAVPAFVEIPVLGEWEEPLRDVARAGLDVKLRCGGLRAELFPTPARLGAVISACAAAGVAFKATAGLHHAVRHVDESTGFVHHGFLNLLVAAGRAVGGAAVDDVVRALETQDRGAVVEEIRSLSAGSASATRHLFTSYGSCSTSEPIEDLRALGLLRAVPTG